MDKAYFGLFGTVVETVIGFVLSEWSRLRNKKRQSKAALLILNLEVNQNISLLKAYWEKVNNVEESFAEDMFLKRLQARLTELPLPKWNDYVWSDQMILLVLIM